MRLFGRVERGHLRPWRDRLRKRGARVRHDHAAGVVDGLRVSVTVGNVAVTARDVKIHRLEFALTRFRRASRRLPRVVRARHEDSPA